MPSRAIVATSTGGLDELQIPHRIRILRLQLRIQGRRLLDGLEVKGSAFHDWMLRTPGQVAETAPPSQIEIANFFRDLIREGYEEVLVLTLSSRLSRTYEQLDLLRNAYAHKLKIHLFDTGMAAHAEALMALEADRLLEQGASMADIVAHLTDLRARTMTFLTVGKLDYLMRTGRVSAASGMLANFMRIRPVLHITEGEIRPYAKIRTTDRALEGMLDGVHEFAQGKPVDIHVMQGGVESTDASLGRLLLDRHQMFGHPTYAVTPVIAAHTGPDCAGVVVVRRA